MALSLYRLAARAYLDRLLTGGTYAGLHRMGNLTRLEVGNSGADTTTYKSTDPDNYGAVIGSTTTPGDDQVNLTMNTLDRKNMAMIYSGSDAALTVASAAVTDEVVTAVLDMWVRLANIKLTADTVTVTDTTGVTTYVLDTDYTLDRTHGLIMALSTGAITAGQSLKVDYTKAAVDGFKISARTQTAITGKFLAVGINMESQKNFRFEADSVEFTLDGVAALVSADNTALEYGLSGIIKVPAGQTIPYYYSEF